MRSRDYLKEFRRLLWERDGGCCGVCKLPVELGEVHIDHVVPIVLGGPDSWENMQVAHQSCNSRKGKRDKPILDATHINASLRLPRGLHDALVRLAESEHRSMHGQIVHLIEQATGQTDTVKRRAGRRRPPQAAS